MKLEGGGLSVASNPGLPRLGFISGFSHLLLTVHSASLALPRSISTSLSAESFRSMLPGWREVRGY